MLQPLTTIHYHPHIQDENRSANVFCDTSIEPTLPGGRPFRIVLLGGGWDPGTGKPIAQLNLAQNPLLAHWIEQGDVVVAAGYTVFEDSTDSKGQFHPDYWLEFGGHLVIDEEQISMLHAEADLVHLIQHLREFGIAQIPDLDRRGERGGIFARSASCFAAWMAAGGGLNRANPTALEARYRQSTLVAWMIQHPTLVSLSALQDDQVQKHLASTTGEIPTAIATVPKNVQSHASVLRWGHLAPKPPCFLTGIDPQVHSGPHTWAGFQNVLTVAGVHTDDHVIAAEQIADHHPDSVFRVDHDPDSIEAERAAWVDGIESYIG